MSDLIPGGQAGFNWSNPSPVYNWKTGKYDSDGMLFIGQEAVTIEDFDTLAEYMSGRDYAIDERTLKGVWHPDWTSYADVLKHTDPKHMMGGLGSPAYEMQKVGGQVRFTDAPIWHTNADGVFDKAVPENLGSYHTVFIDSYGDNFAGPQPRTKSALILRLGGGAYYWDEENAWYAVQKS